MDFTSPGLSNTSSSSGTKRHDIVQADYSLLLNDLYYCLYYSWIVYGVIIDDDDDDDNDNGDDDVVVGRLIDMLLFIFTPPPNPFPPGSSSSAPNSIVDITFGVFQCSPS